MEAEKARTKLHTKAVGKTIGRKLIKSCVLIFFKQSHERKELRKESVAVSNAKSSGTGNLVMRIAWLETRSSELSKLCSFENAFFPPEQRWKSRRSWGFGVFFSRKGLKKTKLDFLFWLEGCAARRWMSAGRRLNWQDASTLTAQGLLPCQIQVYRNRLPPAP